MAPPSLQAGVGGVWHAASVAGPLPFDPLAEAQRRWGVAPATSMGIVDAVSAHDTLGEICDASREVWGVWREQPVF